MTLANDSPQELSSSCAVHAQCSLAPRMESLFRHCMLQNNEVSLTEGGEMLGDSTETALVQHWLRKGF